MKLLLLSICLLLLAISGCGSDSSSAPTNQQPVVDDEQPDIDDDDDDNGEQPDLDDEHPDDDDQPDLDDEQPDAADNDITDAIFTRREGSCADYAAMYVSDVMDVQRGTSFAGDLTITLSGGTCMFETNAIPSHDFNDGGSFATVVSAQNVSYEMTATPAIAGVATELILGDDAIFLNGVKLDLLAAACYDVGNEPLGREKIGCGPDQNDHPWRYDPMLPLNEFGTDRNNAHTQPDGTYHYHGDPMAMFSGDCDGATAASPVIGFAGDGFPIFGSCIDDGGTIRRALSSYIIKDNGGRGSVASSVGTTSTPRGQVIWTSATAWPSTASTATSSPTPTPGSWAASRAHRTTPSTV